MVWDKGLNGVFLVYDLRVSIGLKSDWGYLSEIFGGEEKGEGEWRIIECVGDFFCF